MQIRAEAKANREAQRLRLQQLQQQRHQARQQQLALKQQQQPLPPPGAAMQVAEQLPPAALRSHKHVMCMGEVGGRREKQEREDNGHTI